MSFCTWFLLRSQPAGITEQALAFTVRQAEVDDSDFIRLGLPPGFGVKVKAYCEDVHGVFIQSLGYFYAQLLGGNALAESGEGGAADIRFSHQVISGQAFFAELLFKPRSWVEYIFVVHNFPLGPLLCVALVSKIK